MVQFARELLLQCVHTTYFQRHVICGVVCVFAWVPVSNFSIRLTKRCRNSETKSKLTFLNCFHSASQKTFKFILSSTFRLSYLGLVVISGFYYLLFASQLYSYVAFLWSLPCFIAIQLYSFSCSISFSSNSAFTELLARLIF